MALILLRVKVKVLIVSYRACILLSPSSPCHRPSSFISKDFFCSVYSLQYTLKGQADMLLFGDLYPCYSRCVDHNLPSYLHDTFPCIIRIFTQITTYFSSSTLSKISTLQDFLYLSLFFLYISHIVYFTDWFVYFPSVSWDMEATWGQRLFLFVHCRGFPKP